MDTTMRYQTSRESTMLLNLHKEPYLNLEKLGTKGAEFYKQRYDKVIHNELLHLPDAIRRLEELMADAVSKPQGYVAGRFPVKLNPLLIEKLELHASAMGFSIIERESYVIVAYNERVVKYQDE